MPRPSVKLECAFPAPTVRARAARPEREHRLGTLPRTAPAARGPPRRARSRPAPRASRRSGSAARSSSARCVAAWASNAIRNASTRGARPSRPPRADVRRSASAPSRRRARRRGGTPRWSDRSRAPSSSAISTAGRWNRSTMRDATIPTPACHPSRASAPARPPRPARARPPSPRPGCAARSPAAKRSRDRAPPPARARSRRRPRGGAAPAPGVVEAASGVDAGREPEADLAGGDLAALGDPATRFSARSPAPARRDRLESPADEDPVRADERRRPRRCRAPRDRGHPSGSAPAESRRNDRARGASAGAPSRART